MRRILTFLLLTVVSGAAAQTRFDYFERRNPWLAGANAAGIRQDSVSVSYAEVYFTKENGGLVDFSGSDDSWNAGALTRSVRHLKKISFYGGFGYDYFDGRNMCGSMFTQPGFYPVDMLEFTPGRKVRETYNFTGGVAAVLGRRWTGGVRVDFEAQNYAKRKDLRHKNTHLDFEIAPGILYHAGRFAVGAAYLIGKNSEKMEVQAYGLNGSDYKVFLDKGLFYGVSGLWESGSLHLNDDGVNCYPVKEMSNGGSLQLQYGALYADATYRSKRGETGEKGITWHKFETDQLTAHAALSLGKGDYRHFVRLNLDWQQLKNRENILEYESVGGVTVIHNYGSIPVFGQRSLGVGGEYELAAKWMDLRLGAAYTLFAKQSTLMFPYVKEQELNHTHFFARAIWTVGRWEVTTGADFRCGGFSEDDWETLSGVVPGDYPEQLTDFYNRANEYLTASRVGAELGLRCNIRNFYIDASARYEHGFNLQYTPQANRVGATLAVGYNF